MSGGLTLHQQNYRDVLAKSESGKYHDSFKFQLKVSGLLHLFQPELKFHPKRRWRFDWAFLCPCGYKFGVELQGGVFGGRPVHCHHCRASVMKQLKNGRWVPVLTGGHHNQGQGMVDDMEKFNAAQELGYGLFLFGPQTIENGAAMTLVRKLVSPYLAH